MHRCFLRAVSEAVFAVPVRRAVELMTYIGTENIPEKDTKKVRIRDSLVGKLELTLKFSKENKKNRIIMGVLYGSLNLIN